MTNMTIREYRKAAGLTLEDVANAMKVTVATVSRWETGTRRVPAETAGDLAIVIKAERHHIRPDVFPAPSNDTTTEGAAA